MSNMTKFRFKFSVTSTQEFEDTMSIDAETKEDAIKELIRQWELQDAVLSDIKVTSRSKVS